MKNKIYISIFISLFNILVIYAQDNNYYYYYKDQKVFLTLDKTFLNISTEENTQKSSIATLNFKDFNLEIDNSNLQKQKIAKLEFQNIPTDLEFLQKINSLKENPDINNVSLYFKRNNSSSIGTSNYFYIKLNNSSDFTTLQEVATKKNVQIVRQVPNMPLWYILSLKKNTIGNSLDIANYFYETGFFADVDPAFMFNFKNNCTNDINFGSLWGLYNSANPTIDINACQAWNISQGNGIKVAVVDQGIDKNHNDLSGNISNLSYNAQTSTSPSIFINGNIHGTHVAGTIGAIKDNTLQVVGVAPLSKIMSVSHPLSMTPNISAELASGISWAYQNGADVINNSWGDQGGQLYNQLHSTILENAITSAMTIGRNNKGTLIVFASGNWAVNNPVMDYPATFSDDILTVGAITNVGQRSIFNSLQGSGYGLKLDIVAPGSNILSTIPNDGIQSLDGTSMASPHVAGVCALILSANPSLTGQQVRNIIEQTSQKVGGYSYTTTSGRPNGTWYNEMGYGLIDAYAAVQMAQCMGSNAQISGNNIICNSETYLAPAGGTSYNWTITQGTDLVTLTGNGTANITLTALPNASGEVTLSLIMGGSCGNITVGKAIWVGIPNPIFSNANGFQTGNTFNYGYNGFGNFGSFTDEINLNNSTGVENGVLGAEYEVFNPISNTYVSRGNGSTVVVTSNDAYQIDDMVYINVRGHVLGDCGWSEWGDLTLTSYAEYFNMYTVYPNPSKDIINIELADKKNQPNNKSIIIGELFDIMGQSSRKVQVKNNSATITVSGLPKGIYVLNINIDGKIEKHKIVVE